MDNSVIPEDLYEEIQRIFRLTPVLLVGSGFSCGYGMSSMKALGEHLIEAVPNALKSPESKAVWASAEDHIKEDLEAGLNTIPAGATGREEVITAVRGQTAKLILRETLDTEERIVGGPSESHAPARLLRKLFDGSPQNSESISVITTNYDTLIELFCDIAALPLDTGFSGFRRRRPRTNPVFQTLYSRALAPDKRQQLQFDHRPCKTVRLYKPHGSISWISTADGPVEVLNDHLTPARAIVVPGPTKYQDALVNVLFDSMRTEMNSVMVGANALLCLGFGFNDDHLQGVIKSRLAAGMPIIIVTRNPTSSIEALLTENPHVIAIFEHGNGSILKWRGKEFESAEALWLLDAFMKKFVE